MELPTGEGLSGRRVLVTRTGEQADGLVGLLRTLGATPIELPSIEVTPLDVGNALRDPAGYDWVVFTSANAVRAAALADTPAWPRAAVVGEHTAAAARRAGMTVAFQPSQPRGAAMGEELPIAKGSRVLLVRSDIARPDLPTALRRRGAVVDEVVAYRTTPRREPAPAIVEELRSGRIDAILVASPSSVRGLIAACGEDPALYRSTRVVAIGPTTAAAVRERGLPLAAQAAEPSDRGLVEALIATWRSG